MRRIVSRPHRNAERGAVAILTAVVVGGVMLAVLALTVDVGGMTWERRQMQNSSDAASMALASFCAEDDAGCTEGNAAIGNDLKPLLNQNAQDNLGQLATAPESDYANGYCGRNTMLAPCTEKGSAAWTELRDCPPLPDWLATGDGVKIPYVETYAMTEAKDGTNLLRTIFGGDTTTTQVACARAAWGAPKDYTGTVPVTFSSCEWDAFMKATGSVYADSPEGTLPGYGGAGQPAWPDPTFDKVIYFQSSDKDAPCTNSNGKDNSGGFGDLKAPGCEAPVSTSSWTVGDNGKNINVDCKGVLAGLRGTEISIPVFDCLYVSNSIYTGTVKDAPSCDGSGTGGTANYHIVGWAKFYLSGYVFPGSSAASFIAATNTKSGYPCESSESCVSGWFLSGELSGKPGTTVEPPNGSNDFGAYVVVPAG